MKKLWNWLVTSSADPRVTSLAVKGMLTVASGYVLNIADVACKLSLYCLPIEQTWLTQAVDTTTDITFYVLASVGGIITLIGLLRKLQLGRWSAQ